MIVKAAKDDKKYLNEEMINNLNTNPFGMYLLYLEENQIIGYIYYSDIYDRIEIINFEVKENKRKQGYGEKLLNALIKEKKPITLEVNKNNQPAINLYTKLGFNTVAIRKGYYKGIDGLLMEKK